MLTVLALVTAGGVLAALPLGLGWLIAGRGLQGFGLGLTPVAIAIARDALAGDAVPVHRRGAVGDRGGRRRASATRPPG